MNLSFRMLLLIGFAGLSGSLEAATYNVFCYPGGWSPSYLVIHPADSVRFYNYLGAPFTVYHVTGPCNYWEIGPIPNYSYGEVTFLCDEGLESYAEDYGGYTGDLQIEILQPTPTPDMSFPATSPRGIGLSLIILSILIIVSTRLRF